MNSTAKIGDIVLHRYKKWKVMEKECDCAILELLPGQEYRNGFKNGKLINRTKTKICNLIIIRDEKL